MDLNNLKMYWLVHCMYILCTSCHILRLPCGIVFADFTIIEFDMALKGCLISESSDMTDVECMVRCVQELACKSYSINRSRKICQLNSKALGEPGVALSSMPGWVYKSTDYNTTLIGQTCRGLRPCKDDSICTDICEPPYYKCITCEHGHYGLDCKRKQHDYCINNPCKNGGNCTSLLDKYLCTCPRGFTGSNCEIEINECESLPCFNGGNCTDLVDGFKCTCGELFRGIHCESYAIQSLHSCKEVYEKADQHSGNYEIAYGMHHCVMNPASNCQGGWTLAMAINGQSFFIVGGEHYELCNPLQDDFKAPSTKWTDEQVHNSQAGLESPFEIQAKYSAAMKISFSSICVGMRKSGVTNWVQINVNASSLHDMFQSGTYVESSLGRNAWKELAPGAQLQPNCNREGVNVRSDTNAFVFRIGILGNNENDCRTPDSEICLGGLYASCGARNDRTFMCYILVQ